MRVQRLEPNQCSLTHVWDLNGYSRYDWFAVDLKHFVTRQAILVTSRDQAAHKHLRWMAFLGIFAPRIVKKVGRTSAGGTVWFVRHVV